jgi:hypothetical protein
MIINSKHLPLLNIPYLYIMLVKVHPDNPEARKIDQIAQTLLKGVSLLLL